MKSKTKASLIIGLLIFMLTTSINAQSNYEFTIISFYPYFRDLEISTASDYKRLKIERSEINGNNDVSYVIKEIEKMTKEGWELFNTNSNSFLDGTNYKNAYTFYLRKKIE
jgi:hypothetical protein